MESKIKIEGLDCANCALELEEEISKINGVKEANVSFVNQLVSVSYDSKETLQKIKNVCNNFEEVKVIEDEETFSFKIDGLDCANCALELEEEISKIDGVKEANVDFINQKVKVTCAKKQLLKVKDVCNNFEEVKVIEENKTKKASKLTPENIQNLILIIISTVIFVGAVIFDKILTNDNNKNIFTWISLVLYLISYFVVGYPILLKTIKNVSKGKIFDENFLMTIASIGAMAINERIEGVAVMLLYQIGELLQSIAVNSSRSEIVSMMNLKSETATLIKDDKQIIVIQVN
ncbi:MAG: heavy metal translocating P-type ATPase [Bacilli bacterium]